MPFRLRVPVLSVALTAVSVATSLAFADDARATGPLDVEVAFTPSTALYPWKGNSPFGLGLGGRAGIVLDGFYVGASVMDYLGTTGADPSGVPITKHSQLYGALFGYAFVQGDTWSGRVQVGVGEATVNEHGSSPLDEDITAITTSGVTVHSLYLEPGIDLLVKPLGPLLVGGDATVLVLGKIPYVMDPPTATVGFVLQAQIGLAF